MPGHDLTESPGRFLAGELLRRPRPLTALAGWTVLETLPALLSGQLIARAVDRFVAGQPGAAMSWLLVFGLTYLVAAAGTRQVYAPLAAIVEDLRDTLVHRAAAGTLRRAAAGLQLPDTAGVARMTNQVEMVRDVTAGLLLNARRVVFTLIGAAIGLLSIAPVLLLIIGGPVALALIVFALLMVTLVARQREVILAEERIALTSGPVLNGIRDVVAFGAQRQMTATVTEHVDAQARASRALARAGSLRILIVAIGAHLPLLLLLAAAPRLLDRGLTAGALLGAVTYLSTSLEPALRALVQSVGSSGLRLAVALRRLLQTTAPVPQPAGRGRTGQPPAGYALTLGRITFGYGPHAQPVLHELTLDVPERDHLAVVGPSGAGKSTLANLIAGQLTPQAGSIHIGGRPLSTLDNTVLPRVVTLIPQEAYVFAGSAAENLTYLNPQATREDLDAAVDAIGARQLLDQIGGYRAEVQPAALSAGQRQLIALVRAYLSTAPVTILDEATCHLDPAAEVRAEQAFAARPGTLIVIAHRISSAQRARHVLLLDGARPVYGTHDSLLAASPAYADMVGHWSHAAGS